MSKLIKIATIFIPVFLFGLFIGFIISDDKPFTESELELLSDVNKISVGKKWIQGHSVIAILHHYLD